MTKIIRTYVKPKKRKTKTKAELALQADYERMLARHSKPLEKGAKANGLKIKPLSKEATIKKTEAVSRPPALPGKELMTATTKPIYDPLKDAKQALKGRLGQSYNKGTIQYLTDDELAEQRSGSHKRR